MYTLSLTSTLHGRRSTNRMVNKFRPTDSVLGKKPEISEETQVILKNA